MLMEDAHANVGALLWAAISQVLPTETAPLGWLYLGICKLGAAAVPINLILHGAAMSTLPERGLLPPLTALGIVLCRSVTRIPAKAILRGQ